MSLDAAALVGPYPYRHLEQAGADWLLRQMDRLAIAHAWVGSLSVFLHGDPRPANRALARALGPHRERLTPIPAVDPSQAGWEEDVAAAAEGGAPAVRAYPVHGGLDPGGDEMVRLLAAAAAARLVLILTVRFEDVRQRHPADRTADVPAAAIRALVRTSPEARVLVSQAGRAFIEEVHFGLTTAEATRLLWDFGAVWGPPEDHLALLLETVGPARFTLGTGMPLRIPDAAFAHLDLLDLAPEHRAGLLGENLRAWRSG